MADRRQAVVVLHGMGEQIPMQTLNSFVETVWTNDKSLVSPDKPDPDTGARRVRNAAWAKPDERNSSDELRRITTEADVNGDYTDFFEYYWAHLMHGTTWEHVQGWVLGLLWRNPLTRVPRRVFHAWLALWAVTLVVLFVVLRGFIPTEGANPGTFRAIATGLGALALTAFVSNVLIKRFGDVARYVKAKPPNVARRQEIRARGVELLDRLIASGDYDRIIVVAHSLGAIVAYDILAQLFARHNNVLDHAAPSKMKQPARHRLEQMIRAGAGMARHKGQAPGEVAPPEPFHIDAFQQAQADALAEAQAQGSSWIVSDFVTMGAPLTHAEFLIADSNTDLRARQAARLLPTCPPVMEYDGGTGLRHFSYGPSNVAQNRRLPHHAALFAYTRWTNLFSDHKAIVWGDIISGPLGKAFGLQAVDRVVSGIRDISVMPKLDENGEPAPGQRRRLLTHNHYWNVEKGTQAHCTANPHHVRELRKALGLLRAK